MHVKARYLLNRLVVFKVCDLYYYTITFVCKRLILIGQVDIEINDSCLLLLVCIQVSHEYVYWFRVLHLETLCIA